VRQTFLIFFLFTSLVYCGGAGASSIAGATTSGNAIDTWKQPASGVEDLFWADLDHDNQADVAFAMLGFRYRWAIVGSDKNGFADRVFLLDQSGNYVYLTGKQGLYTITPRVISPEKIAKDDSISEALRKGVERRIFMDAHSALWKPVETATGAPQFFGNPTTAKTMTFRVSITPPNATENSLSTRNTALLFERSFDLFAGKEKTVIEKNIEYSDDLLNEGRPAIHASLKLNLLLLPLDSTQNEAGTRNQWVCQVSGVYKEGAHPPSLFSSLVWISNTGSNFATVELTKPDKANCGSFFIEIFPK
jgi:hypothetical protein